MSQCRKSVQSKKENNLKVCTEWIQEWVSPNQIQEDNFLNIQEVVRGPFSSPRLLTAQPYISYSSCQRQTKYVKNNYNIRRGIPDTWREYLAIKGHCGTIDACVLQEHLIPSCIRYVATDRLWNNMGLPLIQGIPDPWKCRSLNECQPIKCLRQKSSLCRKDVSTSFTYIYDGDDEAEIEYDVKCPFNKDHVNSKNNASQQHKESDFLSIQPEVLQKHEDNSKEIKRRKPVRQLSFSKNLQITSDKKNNRKARNHASKSVIQKQQRLDEEKQSSRKKWEKTLNEKIVKKNIPTVSIETINEAVQTFVVTEDNTKQTEASLFKSHAEENIQRYPNSVCCNCMLQNYTKPNTKYCSNSMNSLKNMNLSNCVLCQNCENIYSKISTKKLKPVLKTDSKKLDKRKGIYRWTKLKVYNCMRKTKKQIRESQRVGHHRIKKKSTIVSKQELKLLCYRCNSSYLKIASIPANDANQKTRFHISEKPLNKSEKERNKMRDSVTKYSTSHRRQNIRGSTKCSGPCVAYKRHVSKRGLEQTLYSTAVKRRNDVEKRGGRELLRENNYNNKSKKETKETKIENVQSKDTGNVGKEGNIIRQCTRLFTDSRRLEKGYESDYDCGTTKRWNRKEDKINDSVICGNEEFKVTQLPHLESDKIMWHSISDSGEFADISDSIVNVGFNVTAQDKSSVTSLTFIHRLNNTALIRNLYQRKKLRKTRVSLTNTLNKHALNIENKRTSTSQKFYPSRTSNNIFYSTDAKKGKAIMSVGTSTGTRKSSRNKKILKYTIM